MALDLVQIAVFCAIVTATVPLLGGYMARVYRDERVFLTPVVGPLERLTYRLIRVDPGKGQDWRAYARSLVAFSGVSWLALYVLLRLASDGGWDLTFNTTTSFVTNTNWQYYAGEAVMTDVAQMTGLAVQNFVSAAVGITVLLGLIRGIASRHGDGTIGNFWQDLTRTLLYVLLPLSVVGALFLVSQGVVQTLGEAKDLAVGPVASQEVIKELGTNGGGFFNVNSSHPFENPNALTNLFELWLILCIPAALTYTYGRMVGSRRQGWAIFSAMGVLYVGLVLVAYFAERHGTSAQELAGLTGANMEGKEQRFSTAMTALWTVTTTVTSCGAVNGAMESLTALGGSVPTFGMGLSEVVFGGVGSGLYVMLLFVILAVFLGGLMVGRTPEYLGKKIEARDVRLTAIGALWTALIVLVFAALAVGTKYGGPSIYASGPQGFSESLYAYLSQANNNGSAVAGYTGTTFADLAGGGAMLLGRFVPMLAVLAVAGSLARKRVAPAGLGTMRTDTPTFVVLLLGTVLLVGLLTLVPALLLGPIVQSLTTSLF
ncbi:MAG: potassium-transporting ATPase subunit KdpA [Solirubrobacterales bacterium]|nr:potassium-transporting ATPase subunit KdpA [Solirubrobacterales bacterium]